MALTKWSDDKAMQILEGNYDGYIQSSLIQLRLNSQIGTNPSNGTAVYNIKENTIYKVRLYMDTRFRIAACSSIAMNTVMTNYYRDAADLSDSTVAGVYKDAEIISEAGQVYMPVVYWASGGSKTWREVYDTIEVRERLSGVLILKSAPSKLEYVVGEEIDLTGMSVALAWSDDSEEVITDYTVSGFDSSAVGTKTVTVSYQGEMVTFGIIVSKPMTPIGIEISSLPMKTEYVIGEEFDTAGLVVSIVYSDGTREATAEYVLSGIDISSVGKKIITAIYAGFSATFEVTVTAPVTLTSIEVTAPTKVSYLYGEEIDFSGMSVKALYSDGTSAVVTDYTVSGYDVAVLGEQTITVSYQEFTDTFMVTVSNAVSGIELTPPVKLEYQIGEAFDSAGMVVYAVWLDGSKAVLTDYDMTGFDSNQIGEKTITVSYLGFTSSFNITIFRIYVLEDILNTTTDMTAIRNNSKNDDTSDMINGVEWFNYNGVATNTIYVNGNNWIGFGNSTEHLKICRRDGAVYYIYRQEGVLDDGRSFLKIRIEGYTTYNSIASDFKLIYELLLFDDNDMLLNLIQTPVESSYLGASALVCGNNTTTLNITAGCIKRVNFKALDKNGSAFSITYSHEYVKEYIGYPTLMNVTATLSFDTGELTISGNGKTKGFSYLTPILSSYKTEIVKVVVEEGVTSLGNYMFYEYTEIQEVFLPESIETMGRNVFYKTEQLDTLYYNCISCECNGWVNDEGSYYTLFKDSGLKNIVFGSKVKKIPAGVFWDAKRLTEILLPLSVETIEAYAFRGCIGIKRVLVDRNVTSIGDNVFYGGVSMKIYIRKPEGSIYGSPWGASRSDIVWLGTDAILDEESAIFYRIEDGKAVILHLWDEGQTELHVPSLINGYRVFTINLEAFKGSSLIYIFLDMPEGTISGEPWGKGKVFWSDTVFENGVVYKTADGSAYVYAFYDSTGNIKEVEVKGLHDGVPVKRISGDVFYKKELDRIILPDSVETIESGAFASCMADVNIPASLKKIASGAFQGSGIKKVVIPSATIELGVYVFSSCPSLERLDYMSSVDIPQGFCESSALTSVYVLGEVAKIGDMAFYGCTELANVHLPEQLRVLGQMAFYNSVSLKTVVLCENITTFGYMCFRGSGLESVTIPPGIIDWGESNTFAECLSLKKVVLSEGIESIGYLAFRDCTALTDVEFPQSLKKIEALAFVECGINGHITLPASVEELGENAFRNCPIRTFAIMNPDCIIVGDTPLTTGSMDTVIYGYPGSTAEAYSAQYDLLQFIPLCHGIHTVTFLDINGSAFVTQTVECGLLADIPMEIPRADAGFRFCGWQDTGNRIVEDMAYPAIYEVETFTVTWRDYDGTTIRTEQVRYLDDAFPPEDPVRVGYIFIGWDKDYLEITADMVITAEYEVVVLTSEIKIDDISIINGDLVPVVYSLLPDNATNKKLIFVTDDKSVASVSEDGILQANRPGITRLTLKSVDGGAEVSCSITVSRADDVDSIWILPNVLYIPKGDMESLTISAISGSDADLSVLWSSSDTSVVTVDRHGKITAAKPGNAMVTARSKTDTSKYAICDVHVLTTQDYLRQLYAQDSINKELIIHSVSGKFSDIKNTDIVEESMIIKEAVCTSTPVVLGGCISNSFEILVSAKRFIDHEPSGEIQVYQVIDGCRVNLFNGIIDSAEKQENKITRKLIAYDKMYTKGDIDLAAWFTNLNFPITVGWLRSQIFLRIGIACQSVKLPCDSFLIYQNYEYYTEENAEEKKKRIIYDIPDKLKAVDIIRDICEVNGMFGWMNRTGAFEYISPKNTRQAKLYPITIQDGEKSYPVNAVEIYLDDKEIDPSITCIGSYNDKQKYNIDDSNFIVNATRGETVYPQTYNSYQETYKNQILNALHEKKWVSFTCRQRFDPGLKIGSDIIYQNDKQFSDGTKYVWKTVSAILERTIEGVQSVTETITASLGYYSASDNKRKVSKKVNNNSKAISNLKSQVSSLGNDYYGDGSDGGGGLKVVSVTEIPTAPDSETIYLIQGEVVVE